MAPTELIQNTNLIAVLAIVVPGIVLIMLIVFLTIGSMVRTRAQESTKRDIAAYVAEGSISAEDGIRMMEAGGEAET